MISRCSTMWKAVTAPTDSPAAAVRYSIASAVSTTSSPSALTLPDERRVRIDALRGQTRSLSNWSHSPRPHPMSRIGKRRNPSAHRRDDRQVHLGALAHHGCIAAELRLERVVHLLADRGLPFQVLRRRACRRRDEHELLVESGADRRPLGPRGRSISSWMAARRSRISIVVRGALTVICIHQTSRPTIGTRISRRATRSRAFLEAGAVPHASRPCAGPRSIVAIAWITHCSRPVCRSVGPLGRIARLPAEVSGIPGGVRSRSARPVAGFISGAYPCSASWTLPTISAPGFTSVLSPSFFHFDGQTSVVFLPM